LSNFTYHVALGHGFSELLMITYHYTYEDNSLVNIFTKIIVHIPPKSLNEEEFITTEHENQPQKYIEVRITQQVYRN